ncbi:hypothetical protein QYF61_001764 [Mycteria americana]|uniref:Uncharacterized protein n=1 Tax=Mycteria americana TaxID=33587 RepID=A0AAN7SI48_MYCAM|nr:hypothetical protein QYF61_001764 [Mycteria americana]
MQPSNQFLIHQTVHPSNPSNPSNPPIKSSLQFREENVPVPMLDNPFSEVKFPNIQSKPPLAQLEAISSCPVTCYLGEETDPHLSTTSFQVVVESDKVSPQPPFLQAKQPQFPQPLLIRLVLQTLHQLRCPALDTLQHLNVSLVVGGPKLNTGFEVRPHQCRVQGTITSLVLLATLFLIQARMPLAFLATWAHCWLILSRLSTNTPRSFSAGQLSSHSSPSLQRCMGLLWPKCRTLHLALLNLTQLASAHQSSLSRSL